MNIRQATSEDLEEVIAVWKAASLPIKPKGRDHPSRLKKQLLQENFWLLVMVERGQIVGTVMVTHDSRKGWINRLAVHPDHQHKGIALKLLLESERILQAAGIEVYAALIESANNPSRKLFEKAGYTFHEKIVYYSKRLSQDS
ncbi:MAG: GNAT family N-acetyltransferase [Candidatus Heimdallarchaeota archaeon]|nr:GNAT family N-acetyltransferase [Candidatus Heimdallarchaeota archaeon]